MLDIDEQDILKHSPRAIEIWSIQRDIKKEFKVHSRPPKTIFSQQYQDPEDELRCTTFYKLGKLIGRGGFGKVNLGMHKLTRKIVAIKSIPKKLMDVEPID